jgi:hypothetical protein
MLRETHCLKSLILKTIGLKKEDNGRVWNIGMVLCLEKKYQPKKR